MKPIFLPSPWEIIRTVVDLSSEGYQGYGLGHHIFVSLYRFAMGFGLAAIVAVPVGLWMGMNSSVRAILDPVIEITRPMPKLALIPLLVIWFGIGNAPKVAIIVLGVFAVLSISAMQGVQSVSTQKIQAAYALGATRWQVFRWVVLPGSLPEIFTGIRVAIGVGVTMLVGAEMIATNDGIAWMALTASDFLRTNVVMVAVCIMGVMGYSLDALVRAIENRIVHWRGKEG